MYKKYFLFVLSLVVIGASDLLAYPTITNSQILGLDKTTAADVNEDHELLVSGSFSVTPSTGSNAIVVGVSSPQWFAAVCSSWNGVSQSSPISNIAVSSATSASASVVVTSASGNQVVDGGEWRKSPDFGSAGTSTQTLIANANSSAAQLKNRMYSSRANGASSVTMGYTIATGAISWIMIGANINQVSAGGTATSDTMSMMGIGG